MSRVVYGSGGEALHLGAELGRGGEGSVFEVATDPRLVAKLYHQTPDAAKQSKLAFMAANADSNLLSYVAWPKATLHSCSGGPTIGFLMGRVNAHEPVHVLYSPRQRQHEFPKAQWDFLLYAARNNYNTGVRVDSVDLLAQKSGDIQVREALMYALQNDTNPGVRLKSLGALGNSLGSTRG